MLQDKVQEQEVQKDLKDSLVRSDVLGVADGKLAPIGDWNMLHMAASAVF